MELASTQPTHETLLEKTLDEKGVSASTHLYNAQLRAGTERGADAIKELLRNDENSVCFFVTETGETVRGAIDFLNPDELVALTQSELFRRRFDANIVSFTPHNGTNYIRLSRRPEGVLYTVLTEDIQTSVTGPNWDSWFVKFQNQITETRTSKSLRSFIDSNGDGKADLIVTGVGTNEARLSEINPFGDRDDRREHAMWTYDSQVVTAAFTEGNFTDCEKYKNSVESALEQF